MSQNPTLTVSHFFFANEVNQAQVSFIYGSVALYDENPLTLQVAADSKEDVERRRRFFALRVQQQEPLQGAPPVAVGEQPAAQDGLRVVGTTEARGPLNFGRELCALGRRRRRPGDHAQEQGVLPQPLGL